MLGGRSQQFGADQDHGNHKRIHVLDGDWSQKHHLCEEAEIVTEEVVKRFLESDCLQGSLIIRLASSLSLSGLRGLSWYMLTGALVIKLTPEAPNNLPGGCKEFCL